jgi:phosphoribosyl 1,2-cyclic phosphodiesterase
MMVASLASGSSGNSYYVQCGEGAILIDAGLSGRRIVENIVAAGGDPARVRGIIVTHDHHDHVAGAGVLQRKYGWKLWMTAGTLDAASKGIGRVQAGAIAPGAGLKAAGMTFSFIGTPHDGREPVMVAVERGKRRCGIFTDLGHVFPGLAEQLEELDFVFMESNYDPDILAANRLYPAPLKARIRGSRGHLSNIEAAELLSGLKGSRLRKVALSHLSQENNRPDLALGCFTGAMAARIRETGLKIGVAPRHAPMRLCAVG